MAVSEETIQKEVAVKREGADAPSLLNQLFKFLSSVRLGVTLLIILGVLSMIGMLIMQQNVEGFDHYYAALKPAQKIVYGRLGFFDIYHAWYFNLLMLFLAITLILASIERAPKTWKIIRNRKLKASRRWLLGQKSHITTQVSVGDLTEAKEKVLRGFRAVGLKTKVAEDAEAFYIFGERGAWNRLGYLSIHVGFLMIILAGFLTTQFGSDGQMPLAPGDTSSKMLQTEFVLDKVQQKQAVLPFSITCLDIEQKLIDPKGPITANNTLDWLTRIRIADETGVREELVHMNSPVDHRGYRFFQASFIAEGKARIAKIQVIPDGATQPQEISIRAGEEANLPNGGKIKWENFVADFAIGQGGQVVSQSEDYNNPALVMTLTNPSGEKRRVFAFAAELPPNAPINQPIMGYRFKLADFEKVAAAHVLSINKDPGKTPFYLGGVILIASLMGVFFFSHQRVWGLIEETSPGNYEIVLGGNTNRHQVAFEDNLKRIAAAADAGNEV
jgi:cytochrome c biogenesis protein